ncbi:hypothetical protein [Streptomyces sp. NPDC059928]|uniref:hypothetical protein n=1 Tax=unclassified Streptomyces TaxID=2593676 RepID=UPI003651B471
MGDTRELLIEDEVNYLLDDDDQDTGLRERGRGGFHPTGALAETPWAGGRQRTFSPELPAGALA